MNECNLCEPEPCRNIIQPCWRYANNTIENQLLQIRSETTEMLDELADNNLSAALIEMLDVYQACITGIEVFRRHGYDVDKAFEIMTEKNKFRGYYAKNGVLYEEPKP
ncbi:MAG: hypothetical protein H6Q73_904 [Firmicutes bacterium]|nr:hypothetical protein [Bacillota bacterium]